MTKENFLGVLLISFEFIKTNLENIMSLNTNVIELFAKRPAISNDEDLIVMYEHGDDLIYYVRNYVTNQEFLVLSNSLLQQLPEQLKPLSNVVVQCNFYIIKQFENEIRNYVLQSNQLAHFYHLFNCGVSHFINSL